jgi:hypothetical protein
MTNKKPLALALMLFVCVCVVAQQGAQKPLPDDGAKTEKHHFTNLNQARYIEIFVMGAGKQPDHLKGNVYNTTFIPGLDLSQNKDTAPQAWVGSLSTDEIAKRFGALKAVINGPKQWMLDWIDIPLGASETFNDKTIPWCAELHLTKQELVALSTPGQFSYKSTTIARKSAIGYNKGTTVFLIDDTDGNTWIMKGFEVGMKPRWTYAEFAVDPASKFTKLPAGWKMRKKVLDKDLILIPKTGVATIMPDEFFNVYDKTGPGYSNYKP